ncbi:hypothetical protein GWL_35990 [Herbaspirillum sp. GW103]|nr:hypothetical protein GWL_35990 [Herbaspirillum sp. GW103]
MPFSCKGKLRILRPVRQGGNSENLRNARQFSAICPQCRTSPHPARNRPVVLWSICNTSPRGPSGRAAIMRACFFHPAPARSFGLL